MDSALVAGPVDLSPAIEIAMAVIFLVAVGIVLLLVWAIRALVRRRRRP